MSIPWRKFAIAGIVLFFLANNLLWPLIFDAVQESVSEECVGFLLGSLLGGLTAQACLLAIWAALGPQRLLVRLPIAYALMVVGVCSYYLGMTLPDWGEMPAEFSVLFAVGLLLLCCGVQLPLVIFRAIIGFRIDGETFDPNTSDEESLRFGLRYLLILTAVVAVLTAMLRFTFPEVGWPGSGPPWREVLFMMGSFAVFSAVVCLPSVWLALGDARKRWLPIALLVFSVLFAPPILVAIFTAIEPAASSDRRIIIRGFLYFGLGVFGTTFLTLLMIRLLGHRLVGPNQRQSSDA